MCVCVYVWVCCNNELDYNVHWRLAEAFKITLSKAGAWLLQFVVELPPAPAVVSIPSNRRWELNVCLMSKPHNVELSATWVQWRRVWEGSKWDLFTLRTPENHTDGLMVYRSSYCSPPSSRVIPLPCPTAVSFSLVRLVLKEVSPLLRSPRRKTWHGCCLANSTRRGPPCGHHHMAIRNKRLRPLFP